MDRNLSLRLFTIVTVAAICIYLLYPTLMYFSSYRSLSEDAIAAMNEGERRDMIAVAKKSMKEDKTLREVVQEMGLMSEEELEQIIDFAKMTAPNVG